MPACPGTLTAPAAGEHPPKGVFRLTPETAAALPSPAIARIAARSVWWVPGGRTDRGVGGLFCDRAACYSFSCRRTRPSSYACGWRAGSAILEVRR